MAATANVYGLFLVSAVNAEVDYIDDTIKAALVTSAYTPDPDTHRYFADITGELDFATNDGYTAGGLTVTGKTADYDTVNDALTLTCDNLTWPVTTFTGVRYMVFYDDTPATDKPLICYVDFGEDQSTTGSPFTYVVPTDGILKYQL